MKEKYRIQFLSKQASNIVTYILNYNNQLKVKNSILYYGETNGFNR